MSEPDDLRDALIIARQRRLEGGEPAHRDPDLARIRRGYYRPRSSPLTASEEYLLRVHAAADARQGTLIFSHTSAAELWGCPVLRADTKLVHAIQPGKARKTTAGTQIHRSAVPDEHVVELDSGLLVTSKAWTALQLAASLPLPNALLPLDHLLRLLNECPESDPAAAAARTALLEQLPRGVVGRRRALANLGLADARSGSPAESLSRGQMVILGVPRPELQVAFPRGDLPGDDVVDFDWPELRTVGEVDGRVKLEDEAMTGGRTPAEVVWDEKVREDRLRRHRPRVARWGWDIAMSRRRLGIVLAQAGVVPVATAGRRSA